MLEINYYNDYISADFLKFLLEQATPVNGVSDLVEVSKGGGLENPESLKFLCELYNLVRKDLNDVLKKRIQDRLFIDQQTKACFEFNQFLKRDYESADYKTIIGLEDASGRIVIGPKNENYFKGDKNKPVAPIPNYLQGNHVTLFGPPDDPKLSINAMNAYHRKLNNEPKIVEDLLKTQTNTPYWGADDEDSKTPLHSDLISAGVNLTECLDHTINFTDPKTNKKYQLSESHLAMPIKRFPGLALPSTFLFYKKNPIPLHLYDFALHLFKNWHNEKALAFYVPKLENEEEARYIKTMISHAENLIKELHPEYKLGTIRLMIVLENPRAVFRANEIIDELHPYFVGASLGWHDYLASTARLFKNDGNYRIPVKADPNIVIKYIKASHELLANVVGERGGIKVGGMYGILPVTTDIKSESFQITLRGYFKDVITQLKRNLTGFWVAHPDFIRIGLAIVEAWKQHASGKKENLEMLVRELLDQKFHKEIIDFIHGPDIESLDINNPLYKRSLLVADIKESNFIANNHPDEIRYNVFQSLQYITDWLSGNGCVALPSEISGTPVRVMDDLATAERSRWEVWHELFYKRFSLDDFLKIVHEEMHFIRKDLSNNKKIVQVKWDDRTDKWYPVAMNLMIRLMTDKTPVEFATELLLPFTNEKIRNSNDPWSEILKVDSSKYQLDQYMTRFNYYFSICGSMKFAIAQAKNIVVDLESVEKNILSFNLNDAIEAASFHGDIGSGRKTLDAMASAEQKLVFQGENSVLDELQKLGTDYKNKFGIKFLVSAQGKSADELLKTLKERINNSKEQELQNANLALFEITKKRLISHPLNKLNVELQDLLKKHKITGASISISTGLNSIQAISLGESVLNINKVNELTKFEVASLSKSIASAFALEFFKSKNIKLKTKVNSLFDQTKSKFRIKSNDPKNPSWGDEVELIHLMSHCALNMHYVNGVPANKEMPPIDQFLFGNDEFGYIPVVAINKPGSKFQYSGGGFIVLEHLIEALSRKSIFELTKPFLDECGMTDFSFKQNDKNEKDYAHGYDVSGTEILGSRKLFPAFAAGGMGTSRSINVFLNHLANAYNSVLGSGPISHDTACTMLLGRDLGCKKFMNALMGVGIFTIEAGPNKFTLHQGANDGFRCLFIHCYDGSNVGYGFTILCNGELNGVLFNAEVAQCIFAEFNLEGIETKLFNKSFEANNISQEEVVNIGYKNLVLNAFKPTLPEKIIDVGPLDSLSKYNLVIDGKVIEVSNEKFARAENLLSPFEPVFDPELFGAQGKIMDSWETVRHNIENVDSLIFEMKKAAPINYLSFSTKFHHGNHTPMVEVLGFDESKKNWINIISKIKLDGHSQLKIKLNEATQLFQKIKVLAFPDGGLSRLGLYTEIPNEHEEQFKTIEEAKCVQYTEVIPKPKKPLSTPYFPDDQEFNRNWKVLKTGDEYDVANRAFGGKILSASNEHYGPAIQTISPFGPMHMFDGFESARSRVAGHTENAIIELARKSKIHRVEMNFSYFVNNNPMGISIFGLANNSWVNLIDNEPVKAFAKNIKNFEIKSDLEFTQIKVIVHPDGGINRIRVFAFK